MKSDPQTEEISANAAGHGCDCADSPAEFHLSFDNEFNGLAGLGGPERRRGARLRFLGKPQARNRDSHDWERVEQTKIRQPCRSETEEFSRTEPSSLPEGGAHVRNRNGFCSSCNVLLTGAFAFAPSIGFNRIDAETVLF
jgi:hypothetical protein